MSPVPPVNNTQSPFPQDVYKRQDKQRQDRRTIPFFIPLEIFRSHHSFESEQFIGQFRCLYLPPVSYTHLILNHMFYISPDSARLLSRELEVLDSERSTLCGCHMGPPLIIFPVITINFGRKRFVYSFANRRWPSLCSAWDKRYLAELFAGFGDFFS